MKRAVFKYSVVAIILLVMVYVAGWYKPVAPQTFELSMNLTSDYLENTKYQIFYLTGEGDFSEENSFVFNTDVGETKNVKAELPLETQKVRVDVGEQKGKVKIEKLKFKYGSETIILEKKKLNTFDSVSGISSIKFQNNSAIINSISDDPYFVWNISNLGVDDYVKNVTLKDNFYVKILVEILLIIVLACYLSKWNYYEEFILSLYRNRKLLIQLSKNDFKTRFAGSYLGIVWAFIQPMVLILVYWFVFQNGLRSGNISNVPFILWLLAGLVPWFVFSEGLNVGTGALIDYQYLVKKVVFQIDILPLVKLLSALYVHVFFVCFTLILYACYGYFPNAYMLQVIYYSFCICVLTLGLCYLTSALVVFFRDLTQIINIVLQIGIWMTPIMWNIDTMGLPKWLKVIFELNPMFYIVDGYRDALIRKVWFWQRPSLTIYFWIVTMLIFTMGIVVFKKLKVHFADVL